MLDKVYQSEKVDAKWSEAWKSGGAFTPDPGSGNPPYTIILPPPNITGVLTVGHALGTTVQDVLVRWKRMKGMNVLYLPGLDHAGIATQKVVERALEERGVTKEELGREGFIEECWKWKEQYGGSIIEQLDSLGASLDWTRLVFTLDPGVSRAVREVFVRLYNKDLIYRGRYIVNWCPSCQTAISDEEVEYRDSHGKLYYIAYPFVDGEGEIVVGTTRPETMLGDVAVAMSPADERAPSLEGRMLHLPLTGRTIPVILDDAVDPEFGTGCLKVTPAHDTTDFQIGQRHGFDPVIVIDREGRMNDAVPRFAGLERYKARKAVLEALEEEGFLRTIEDYDHSVGHHDRCDTVIEPAISRQWFLRMKTLAEPAIDVVVKEDITFFPERWRNIYLSWMENIRDWCISRQLWWGHRIPVWYCADCSEEMAAVEAPGACAKCSGSNLTQDEDVLDTWFSSWLWTFSPMGWPRETEDLDTFHPTSVLVTGGDIIFFWVARMIMASLEFRGEIPFSKVYITGIVRDGKGLKMSKSLGNSPDPIDIIQRNGADAMRFTLMMLSPPGQDLLFDEGRIEVGRHFANKIWNAARFVLSQDAGELAGGGGEGPIGDLYCALFERGPGGQAEFGWEERWIASRLARAAAEFEGDIDAYRIDEAARTIYDFFWHEFCDWYLELAKPALREGGARGAGAASAARCVLGLSMTLLHALLPFITEEIWSMLAPEAGMLSGRTIPEVPVALRDISIEADVDLFREIVSSVRNLRQSFNVPQTQQVDVVINCEAGRSLPDRLGTFSEQMARLTKAQSLDIAENAERPPGSVAAGLADLEIYVALEGIIDLEAERLRLRRDLDKIGSDCEKIEARLNDERFLGKAPADVVERERNRFAEISDRRKHIEKILEDLG
jgi:valyl-tRNA synthetase